MITMLFFKNHEVKCLVCNSSVPQKTKKNKASCKAVWEEIDDLELPRHLQDSQKFNGEMTWMHNN